MFSIFPYLVEYWFVERVVNYLFSVEYIMEDGKCFNVYLWSLSCFFKWGFRMFVWVFIVRSILLIVMMFCMCLLSIMILLWMGMVLPYILLLLL